jgi:hypothetical protein
LTRPLTGRPQVLAIAVYSEPHNGELVPVPAQSDELEGVACVDDAARCAVHTCRLYRRYGSKEILKLALGYLRFICSMQQSDGSIANFVLDWKGTPNLTGTTSYPGGEWWFVRGMRALAVGATEAPDICIPSFRRGLERLTQPFEDSRVQAIALLALLAARNSFGAEVDSACRAASHVLAEQMEAGRLNVHPWLWGEVQEGALASASLALGEPTLGEAALTSASRRLIDAANRLYSNVTVIPYDASSVAWSCRKLYELSADQVWLRNLVSAVSWFYGYNSASAAVYNRRLGLVYDGVCSGEVSKNSGAEANIEGAEALLESIWLEGMR